MKLELVTKVVRAAQRCCQGWPIDRKNRIATLALTVLVEKHSVNAFGKGCIGLIHHALY